MVPAVFAQVDWAWNLVGTITDPSIRELAGATITVTNRDTQQLWTVTSGEKGKYRVKDLRPGVYNIKVSAQGYKTIGVQGLLIALEPADEVLLSFSLEAEPPKYNPPSEHK